MEMSNLDNNLASILSEYGKSIREGLKDRHPSSVHMLKVLAPNPNLTGELATISEKCWDLGLNMFINLPDGPELTAGLRKLVETKDCFVRAKLDENPVDYRDR